MAYLLADEPAGEQRQTTLAARCSASERARAGACGVQPRRVRRDAPAVLRKRAGTLTAASATRAGCASRRRS
jgi:hypothetical protein